MFNEPGKQKWHLSATILIGKAITQRSPEEDFTLAEMD